MAAPLKTPAPIYTIDYVNGRERVPVYTYNRDSMVFTPTAFATGRASILTNANGWVEVKVEDTLAMTVNPESGVRAKAFSYLRKPNNAVSEPRLEFIRKASSIKQLVGSLTKAGKLSVYQLREEAIPNSTDQLIFQGGGFIDDTMLETLVLDMPIQSLPYGSQYLTENVQAIVGGEAGQEYLLTLRFLGRMETRNYTSPVSYQGQSPYFVTGEVEDPLTNPRNVWRLTISDPAQTFYLNNQALLENKEFDYTITGIHVNSGAVVQLYYNTVDMLQLDNQDMAVSLVDYSVVGQAGASIGPKGLIAGAFRETENLLNSYLLASPSGNIIVTSGNRLIIG